MIEQRQAELGITDSALGKKSGVGRDVVRFWKQGRTKGMPSYDKVIAILDALDIGESPTNIPFYGEVPGGVPLLIEEPEDQTRIVRWTGEANGHEIIEMPKPKPHCFALRVRGQSMNLVAPEGHFIIVNPNLPPIDELDNKLVVAEVQGECTFKRFGYKPLRLEPLSTDMEFRAQFFDPDEIRIVGIVELIMRDLR